LSPHSDAVDTGHAASVDVVSLFLSGAATVIGRALAVNFSLTQFTKMPRFFAGSAAIGPNRCRVLQPFTCKVIGKGIRSRGFAMRRPIETTGFLPPAGRKLGRERRTAAIAELVAGIALALGTVIAATVVTVGIARADVAGDVVGHEGSLFAVALVLGLLFIAMGGLTALSLPAVKPRRHRH
jgi:hypothetical protein